VICIESAGRASFGLLMLLLRYLRNLNAGRLTLWCYFLWYLVVLVRYFDPSPRLWATSFGLCLIVGFALYVNTTRSGVRRVHIGFWPGFRLFMMPLCVSSFSALVKGRGFFLIFSPDPRELALATGLCATLCLATWVAKRTLPPAPLGTRNAELGTDV
jgi:hypothetical protein